MSDDGSGEKGVWNPVPSTNTKQNPHTSDQDIIHGHNSASDCESPNDKSYTSCSSCSLRYNLPSGGSDGGNIQKTSEFPRKDLKEQEQTRPNTEMKQNRDCNTKSKAGSKGFWWSKSFPWKSLYSKSQQLQGAKAENAIIERVSSAQLHKIKALSSELHSVQRMLDEASSENKLLTRLQHRHTKALQRYESPESSVHQLVTRHHSEVRALKEILKSSQERERYLSKKLKEAESELLKTNDQLQKLQKLSEDKNLAERDELSNRLSELVMKMEIDEKKVKALERQHHLTVSFYDRQLYLERKKLSDARDTTQKLQDEILSLQKKIKEKDRELDIKNIYANRMPRDLYKYESLFGKRGLTLTKSTQTMSDMLVLDQQNICVVEEGADLQAQSNEFETDKGREEENNSDSQRTNEDTSTHDVQQTEESCLLETDSGKTEQYFENETLEEELDKLLGKGQQDPLQCTNSRHDELFHENKFKTGEGRGESGDTFQSISFIPRLRRNYKFTEATENLHQGLPATGPLSSVSSVRRNLMFHGDSSLGLEPSFSKNKANKWNDVKEDKTEKRAEMSHRDKKNMLMEELFGPRYSFKN
ncbi:lebercilin-like protein isoform X2 [Pseudophryne corroboree]|uniref:lebercilin-like protein isoform X2 n=1 Tax=Pseudophryne corroboree TaxID=495146 RepID=UPI003081824C